MESTGGMNIDKQIDEIEMDITIALCCDDLDTLISLVDITPVFKGSKYFSVCEMLEGICEHDAVNCATSLLEGVLGLEMDGVDVNMPIPGLGEVFPLHYAAKHACPEVLQLFLSRGAQTDIELYDPLNKWGYDGLLPLEIALDVVRENLSEESDIWPEPSTFQLIASLCLPSMKDSLKAVELLASSSKNVEKIAYYYAMNGHLIELAVLLTVAREKVFAPITFSRQNGDNWIGRMTLEQWLKLELRLLHIQECKVLEPFAEKKSTWIERKKRLLESIALLLDVFGKAGNAIEEYMKLERHREDVKTDVALKLVDAGCRLKDGDFDFNIVYWMNSGGSGSSPIEYQRIGVPFLHRWPSPIRWNSLSRKEMIPCNGYGSSSRNYASKRTHSHVPKSNFGSHYSTSSDFQVKNQMKAMEQGLPKYLPMEKLAYISIMIKKWIRSA